MIDQVTDTPEPQIAQTFEELITDPALIEILRKLNISVPTEIQARSIPLLIEGKDAILQAQTGSGKTLAFVLPLISQLKNAGLGSGWSSLIITPTRELSLQIESVVKLAAPEVKPVCVIGGADMQAQIRALREDNRVIIGTPGRILDLIRQKELRLKQCRFFAVDEVDELLSSGFLEDIRQILSRLPDKRQGVFVSATITPRVEMLAHSFLNKPARVIAGNEEPSVEHFFCEVGADLLAKTVALCDIVETLRPRSAIIFCNTKSDTQLVEALLRRRGFDARRINSDLSQKQRNRIMRLIRDQELQLLVATDVAARGIDIEQLDLVVNYSIHDQPETYVHRTGRTGRAGRSGRAISLIGPRDFGAFHHLTKVLPTRFEKFVIPGDKEVADARLTHLYELLRVQNIEVRERDILVARQFLKEQGAIEEPSESLETLVAKLCRMAIEHALTEEAEGLDEEEGSEEQERREPEKRGKDSRRSQERQERPRRDRQQEHSGQESSPEDGSHGHSRQNESRHRDSRQADSRRSDSRHHDSRPQDSRQGDSRRNDSRRDPQEEQARDHEQRERSVQPQGEKLVRLFVGQGISHGMNPEVFSALASDIAEIPGDKILASRFRERYGFVDVVAGAVEPLVHSLNGIEYSGSVLVVEVAMIKEPERSGYQGGRRHGGRSRPHGSRSRDSRGERYSA